jgi:hypothetical protein
MVRLTKSKLPSGVTITKEQDYRSGIVFDTIVQDCHGKCYLCEDKPTTINVEHIVPHRSAPSLKFDWDNLFIACGHCNNLKRDKYVNIINPLKVDPEEHIALSLEITDNLVEQIIVEPLSQDTEVKLTVEFLCHVYNGGSTDIKGVECANLRNRISKELSLFYRYVDGYKNEPELHEIVLAEEIGRSSEFAAFKRKIIRDDPTLSVQFAYALI